MDLWFPTLAANTTARRGWGTRIGVEKQIPFGNDRQKSNGKNMGLGHDLCSIVDGGVAFLDRWLRRVRRTRTLSGWIG